MKKQHTTGQLRNIIRNMINEELSGHMVAEEEHNFLPEPPDQLDDIPSVPESIAVPDESNESLIIRLRQTPTYKQLLLGSTKLKEGNPLTKRLKNKAVTKVGSEEYKNYATVLNQLGNLTGHETNLSAAQDPQKSLKLGRQTLGIGGRTITE